MNPAGTLGEYLASPLGRYYAGAHLLHWRSGEALGGVIAWGRLDEEDVRQAFRVIDMEIARGVPHVSLIDGRRVEGGEFAAFALLAAEMERREGALSALVRRLAVVRPTGGVPAAVGAGFRAVLRPPFPVADFTDPGEALRWLGCPDRALAGELDLLHAAVAGAAPVVRAVRDLLAARSADTTLRDAARALGIPAWTLQRRLREAGATFREERLAARLRAAEAMLLVTDAKLTAVAHELGWSSLQHFSAAFRRFEGESPSAWRARRRR